MNKTPLILYTERLILAVPAEDEFQRFYAINADPQTNLFNPAGPMNNDTARKAFSDMLRHWNNHGFGAWSVSEKINPGFTIGFGGLSDRFYGPDIRLNLGYRLDKNYWKMGYATEIARAAIAFGFTQLKKEEIFALVRPDHVASIRVLEKCQMECYDKLYDLRDAPPSLVYRIAASDWKAFD